MREENRQNTPENQNSEYLEGKARTYRRIARYTDKVAIAGMLIAFTQPFIHSFQMIVREKPAIVQNYENAQATTEILEGLKPDLSSKLHVPYETPKIRETLDLLYDIERKKVSELDKVIADVKEDIAEIKENPEYVDYNEREIARIRRTNTLGLVGALTFVASFSTFIFSILKAESYEKKSRKLKEQGEEK